MTITKKSCTEKGSTIVESALCLTLFLMITFGTIDFGRAVFAYNFVSYAAREATRYAMVRGSSSSSPATNAGINSYVTGFAVGLDPSALTVNTIWTPDNKPGSTVAVTVKFTFSAVVPYVPAKIPFQSTSTMIIAQ